MEKINICFIMDEWDKIIVHEDSTILFIQESLSRGYNVGVLYSKDLSMQNNITIGFVNMIVKNEKYPVKIANFHKSIKFIQKTLPMSGFDSIVLREDPPLNNIVLNFLDSIKDDTFIVNDIDGLRKANNKLYVASLTGENGEYVPETFVSKNKEYLKNVIKNSKTDKLIMKPLNGFGGSGVILIEKNATQNINSLLDFYIDNKNSSNYVILQNYIEGAEKGDVRIIMLNGKVISAIRRVPAKGEVRSNIHVGGVPEKYTLTKADKKLCNDIGTKIVEDGLFYVGLDLINGKIIEINVISPGAGPMSNKLNKIKVEKLFIDFIESVIIKRKKNEKRKIDFQKTLEKNI